MLRGPRLAKPAMFEAERVEAGEGD
jgi:hypothetical protein